MEARKVIITSTRSSSKKVINTTAETLGELKADLDEAGVDYDGLTFYEGLSKTELKSDESILPKDVPYKGTVTNNLVFLLTNPDKKIASGSDRAALYSKIKEMNLQETVKEEYGKNFTMCKSEELQEIIDKFTPTQVNPSIVENSTIIGEDPAVRNALDKLLDILVENCSIEEEDADYVRETLKSNSTSSEASSSVEESPYSDKEIAELFS